MRTTGPGVTSDTLPQGGDDYRQHTLSGGCPHVVPTPWLRSQAPTPEWDLEPFAGLSRATRPGRVGSADRVSLIRGEAGDGVDGLRQSLAGLLVHAGSLDLDGLDGVRARPGRCAPSVVVPRAIRGWRGGGGPTVASAASAGGASWSMRALWELRASPMRGGDVARRRSPGPCTYLRKAGRGPESGPRLLGRQGSG